MAHVCLVRPLLSPSDFNGYPLNLLILGASLERAGHTVEICDYDFLKEVDPTWLGGGFAARAARQILDRNPQFVGITAMCSNYVLALDLAAEVKRLDQDVHITLGGPHVSLCASGTLERYRQIDSAVVGEGEITYPELVTCVSNSDDLRGVAGVVFRCSDTVITNASRPLMTLLDDSPPPNYELINLDDYIAVTGNNYLEIYAGSGCPFTCTFCSTSIVWERRYRTMSPQRIVSEVEKLSKHGATAINLIHDNLTVRKPFIAEIADAIRTRTPGIRWGFSSRIDTIDRNTIELVTAAGCDYVFFGVESASVDIQKSMGKRLKLRQIHEVLDTCLRYGIQPTTSFILGFPDEELDDVRSTIRLAFECRARGARRSFINLLSAYTGTPVMREQQDRMKFVRSEANTTMTSFLEEHHYAYIENDREVFSNYYSIDYSQSAIGSASKYGDLVDFYTICLFKYRFSIAHLINEIGVDPIAFFDQCRGKISDLSVEQRNKLGLDLSSEDIRSTVLISQHLEIETMHALDLALWSVTTNKRGVLVNGKLVLNSISGDSASFSAASPTRYFLVGRTSVDVHISPLSDAIGQLYEAQGMEIYRPASLCGSAVAKT